MRKIKTFIQEELPSLLREEAKNLRLTTEGDLQSLVYHFLRKEFDTYFKSGQYSIINKPTFFTKKRRKKKWNQDQPDLVIYNVSDSNKPKPIIVLELKEKSKVRERHFKNDFKKFQRFKGRFRKIKHFYFICISRNDGQNELKDILKKYNTYKKVTVISIGDILKDKSEIKSFKEKLDKISKFNYNRKKKRKR